MMRTVIAIAALLISLVAVRGAMADADPAYPASRDGRCRGDDGTTDFDRSEVTCLKQVGDIAERVGPKLGLTFPNENKRNYLNEDAKCQGPDVEECIKYRLVGYFPENDLILIEVGYWEGVSWLLVRADTGDETEIVSPPHYSPDKRWLAAVASSIGPAGPPDGMDIVPTVPDAAVKAWHYRIPDEGQWLYAFAGWDGNSRVKMTATSLAAPERRVQASIEYRDGDWRLMEPQ